MLTSSKGFSFEADYWSVGVVAYQLMLGGDLPFIGNDFDEVKQAHASHDICLKTSDVPVGWNWQAADFINKCLQKRPEKRIGIHRGSKELKQHPWFDDFDWQALQSRTMRPPFMPNLLFVNLDQAHANRQRPST